MKCVLIAEDEASIRDFVVINLKRSGYEVIEASNGEEAIEKFDKFYNQIDVVILDIMMPVIDGLEVCKYIREKSKRTGIIMLTARTQEMDKVTGLMVGADDYVTKPFSPSELMARIDAIYRRVALTIDNTVEEKPNSAISLNEFVLDLRSHTLTKYGEPVELTQVEFQIMEYLILLFQQHYLHPVTFLYIQIYYFLNLLSKFLYPYIYLQVFEPLLHFHQVY